MSTINDIIDLSANLEVKRALAVKMINSNFKTDEICALLNVSASFVSKWKIIYEDQGVEALHVNYQGGTGFLTPLQRDEIFCYLKDKPYYSLEELQEYIKRRYNIVYQSKQSYYDILKDAGLSWHRTQAVNPKQNEEAVLLKREEIKKNWTPAKRT